MRTRKVRWIPRPNRHPGRKALAYHEAGHAVIGYAMGLEIEQVTIIPGEGSLGRCRYQGWDEAEAVDLDTALIVILAGAVAEEIAVGAPSRGADERRALALSLSHGISEAAAAERILGARRFVDRFLEDHWPIVKALAAVLRKERALDGAQAHAVIARAYRKHGVSPSRGIGLLPSGSSGFPRQDANAGPTLLPSSSPRPHRSAAER